VDRPKQFCGSGEKLLKILNSLQPIGLLGLRIALGIIFVAHGYPKLAHLRGGSQMQSFFVEHGLPGYFVYIAGVIETFGGGLLLLGLFTRAAALLLAIEMCVAIWKVHSGHGYLAVHDYEFPLTLATACFALATVGAGMISLDQPLFEGAGRVQPKKNVD
jgi:putative oxidoreductase